MVSTELSPKEQREMRVLVLQQVGIVRPRCWFCDKILAVGFFCFGCQEFVCDDCDNGTCSGKHSVEEHCKSEVENV